MRGGSVIGIIGAGSMGLGIAQCFLLKNYNVLIYDHKAENIEKFLTKIQSLLGESQMSMLNLRVTTYLESLSDCDFIIESISEDIDRKKELIRNLNNHIHKGTILVSNTSSCSMEEMSSVYKYPQDFMGMHFFKPANKMKLIEAATASSTSQSTIDRVKSIADDLQKELIIIKDSPCFIVNRLLIPMINDAFDLLGEGKIPAEQIDKAMTLGCKHPMGPLELADYIGLDIVYQIMCNLMSEVSLSKYRPSKKLKEYVDQGRLGRKTKIGVYNYHS